MNLLGLFYAGVGLIFVFDVFFGFLVMGSCLLPYIRKRRPCKLHADLWETHSWDYFVGFKKFQYITREMNLECLNELRSDMWIKLRSKTD